MIRLLHLLAISLLIGSAAYAYSTKYETLYYAETLAKTKGKLQKEREAIAIAKAEWALLTRPDRLQRMVDRHLDLQPMTVVQLARLSDIPTRGKADPIAAKIDALGGEPSTTGSTGPAPAVTAAGKAKPAAPPRGGIGAKLDSLGLGKPMPTAAKAKPTAENRPPAQPAAAKPGKPATTKPAPAKPVSPKSTPSQSTAR